MTRYGSPALSALLFALLTSVVSAAPDKTVLIRGGYVMPMTSDGDDLPQGDLLIRNNAIVAVGEHLSAPDAEVIEAKGSFVLPGFVDAHSHLWVTTMRGQFRNGEGKFFPVSSALGQAMQPEDIYTAIYTGALELVNGGITTSGDFFDNIHGPAWGDAGFSALRDAGIRAILFYGGPDKTTRFPIDTKHAATLADRHDPRVRVGLAWRLPRELKDEQNWAMRDREYQWARDHHLPVQVHISGEPDAMFNALIARHYLAPFVTLVHATDARPAQLQALEKAHASLAVTPLSEEHVGYGLTRLDHFASVTRLGLGIDGNSLAGSGDMFANMRLAALTMSGAAADEALPKPRQLLRMATLGGAEALGLDKETGSLTVGKRADIQIITPDTLNMSGFGGGDPAALLLYSAQPQNVTTVIVDGRVIKQHGKLNGVSLAEVLASAQRSAERIKQRAAEK
ncbi:amidohydrolase family protein (plasmid) [Pantoea piersonii]|uniref:Amidohydrolase family protein n=1 Tax=Pantoea piersonii TaxID=2364647 RepID=A0AAJ5UBV2_9GAMM|nr:amidohydrolase family protein [Pantoea piersonii]WBG93214.1 amidohydrolase family protein [Pantoea piersonii]